MEKSPERNNMLYRLDEDYVNDLKRETRKQSFGLADYLPNSIKRKPEYSSTKAGHSRN